MCCMLLWPWRMAKAFPENRLSDMMHAEIVPSNLPEGLVSRWRPHRKWMLILSVSLCLALAASTPVSSNSASSGVSCPGGSGELSLMLSRKLTCSVANALPVNDLLQGVQTAFSVRHVSGTHRWGVTLCSAQGQSLLCRCHLTRLQQRSDAALSVSDRGG